MKKVLTFEDNNADIVHDNCNMFTCWVMAQHNTILIMFTLNCFSCLDSSFLNVQYHSEYARSGAT